MRSVHRTWNDVLRPLALPLVLSCVVSSSGGVGAQPPHVRAAGPQTSNPTVHVQGTNSGEHPPASLDSRIRSFERMRRRGRRVGFVTTGFAGASMIKFTLGFTVDWKRPEDPPPYVSTGEFVSILVGGSLALVAVPTTILTGGLLGRSGRQLRMLARAVPTANVVPGGGVVVGAAGRF